MRTLICLAIAIAAVGCSKSSEFGDNGAPAAAPKPLTADQKAAMPPEASAHVDQMSEYAKAQQNAMGQRPGGK